MDSLFSFKKLLGKENNYSENWMDIIEKFIHDTGLYIIDKDKLKNLEVLIILNDINYIYKTWIKLINQLK